MIDPVSGPTSVPGFAASSGWAQVGQRSQAPTGQQATGTDGKALEPADQRKVEELEKRDREVRTHEQAHIAAGGNLVQGGASFTYQLGPDGKRYAVGGEVQIDTSEGRTPQDTITKMQRVRAAALAPQQPSSQDLQVAAQAAQKETMARMELAELRQREQAYSEVAANDQPGAGSPPSLLAVA